MINKFKKIMKDNKIELYYILFLILTLLIISIPRLLTQYNIGIGNWDTFLYLENARSFAKMGWGDVPSISPVVPYILSLFFRLAGHPYQEAIFNLSVISYIAGVVSFYLILRYKFDNRISFVGSIIYATFTLLYSWVAIGGNDITGVSLTLLTVYLIILAHNINNKYYYLALIIAAFAFLSRYTAGVMIFAIFFYLIICRIDKKELKAFIVGGIIGTLSISTFLYNFYRLLGTPFPFLGQFSGTVSNTKVLDAGYLPDTMYYINHIPNYLNSYIPPNSNFNNVVNPMGNIPGIFSDILILLFLTGMAFVFINIYRNIKDNNANFLTANNRINMTITLILSLLCILSINNTSYIITLTLALSVLFMIELMVKRYKIKYLKYDLFMLALLLVYLIFQSILSTKNDRYFITVLPFIAYFITNALYYIYGCIDRYVKLKQIKASAIISCLLVLFLVANSLYYNSTISQDNPYSNIEEACQWFGDNYCYDNQTVIYSDNWPGVTWYLNIYVRRGVPDVNNQNISWSYTQDILSSNSNHTPASFYIDTNTPEKVDYVGLSKIKEFDTVVIYQNSFEQEHGVEYLSSYEYVEDFNNTFSKYN